MQSLKGREQASYERYNYPPERRARWDCIFLIASEAGLQFSLLRLFGLMTASAILAAVCRVAGPRVKIAPGLAAAAFGCAVLYGKIEHPVKYRSLASNLGRLLLRQFLLLLGMACVVVFLMLITGFSRSVGW